MWVSSCVAFFHFIFHDIHIYPSSLQGLIEPAYSPPDQCPESGLEAPDYDAQLWAFTAVIAGLSKASDVISGTLLTIWCTFT